jgi:collagen type V/XI/XXIV/XXVII alpha
MMEKIQICTFLLADEAIVDLISKADLWEESHGIRRILGRCFNNTEDRQPLRSDWAYRFNENQVSLSSGDLFPQSFPRDFSVLLVARTTPGHTYNLFTIYSEDGEEQLAVSLGSDITFYYQDVGDSVEFGLPVDDGE